MFVRVVASKQSQPLLYIVNFSWGNVPVLAALTKGEIFVKKVGFQSKGIMILGLVFFTIGLLAILQESFVFGLFLQMLPDAQTAIITGAVIQLVGQALLVFGVIKANSNKLTTTLQVERQLTMSAMAQNMEQFQAKMQNQSQAIMAGYNQAIAKLDNLLAVQRTVAVAVPAANAVVSCKYCGSGVQQGRFCPRCGKAS